MPQLSVTPIADGDLWFVREMLFEAAFWRDPARAPSLTSALAGPELAHYVDGWGRDGDVGFVARVGREAAGAVWTRLFTPDVPGYGYVDDVTPELSIGVRQDFRGRGIGSCLLTAMLAQARLDGRARVSLSVEVDNPALALYQRVGFDVVGKVAGAVTMVRVLE